MLRRLSHEQPESFDFTPANLAWAEAQITKYPEGRQASAIIPLLWRAQEQEGWLSRPAIEYVADMLGLAHIRALEVATFYFMFQLHPVGSVANIQICGTTTCMICGSGELMAVCREKIAEKPHTLSADGKFSWEEVECLGACTNAPMVQIGKDFYEDLTGERLAEILDALAAGEVPTPGPQNGRVGAEPLGGPKVLTEGNEADRVNASVELALALGDTVRRIDGSEVPLLHPWADRGGRPVGVKSRPASAQPEPARVEPAPALDHPVDETGVTVQEAPVESVGKPDTPVADVADDKPEPVRPPWIGAPLADTPEDLISIKGIGPKLVAVLNYLGIYHISQIAAWTPAEVAWMDANMSGFPGRVSRDDWVGQAKAMLADRDAG
ncbi:NADH-quinone oxidoreductase subunit E [Tropicimonas sp. IMCC34043]|uniref:NADH-quinone oxidoreductase subunit E n=1 Tax=Tropicimonas sp. IMCC34043 TaxID=2248760 RepID=UPI000E220D91|nr:NADH-quinone oxidoreductase subunit E [Tropicimonas sp. IMCC34043]